MDKRARGNAGEDCAAATLERHGWDVLARNVRSPEGELDIVARRDGVLAFVEVKARTQGDFGQPGEAVTPRKRRKIVACAERFLLEHPEYGALQPRFDVAEVRLRGGKPCAIRYLAGAFTLDDL